MSERPICKVVLRDGYYTQPARGEDGKVLVFSMDSEPRRDYQDFGLLDVAIMVTAEQLRRMQA